MKRKVYMIVLGLAAALAGCGGGGGGSSTTTTEGSANPTGSPTQPGGKVRAINALDGVATASWAVTGQTNLSFPAIPFGSVTASEELNSGGQQTVNFYNSATPGTVSASTSIGLSKSSNVTVVAYGSGSSVAFFNKTSDSTNGPNVRVIDGAKKAGNLDIFIVPAGYPPAGQSSPISPGGVYPAQNANGAYVYYPLPLPGSYTVSAYPEGHDTGTPVFSTTLTVANTDVYTLVLVDAASAGGTPTVLQIPDNS